MSPDSQGCDFRSSKVARCAGSATNMRFRRSCSEQSMGQPWGMGGHSKICIGNKKNALKIKTRILSAVSRSDNSRRT